MSPAPAPARHFSFLRFPFALSFASCSRPVSPGSFWLTHSQRPCSQPGPVLATRPWGQAGSTRPCWRPTPASCPAPGAAAAVGCGFGGAQHLWAQLGCLGCPLVLVRASLGMEAHCLLGPVPCLERRQRDRAQAAVGRLGAELGMNPTPSQPLSSGRGGAAALPSAAVLAMLDKRVPHRRAAVNALPVQKVPRS